MQTLGLAESTPRTDGRLKSLFWPSIQTGADVDYLGAQGYWLCTLFAITGFVFLVATGHPIAGVAAFLLYYLSGVGIRERSRFAAAITFVFSLTELLTNPGVLKVLFVALMLSNLRATWIASGWKPESEESALPPRLNETFADRIADRFPQWLWPKVRILYYVFSICFALLLAIGLLWTRISQDMAH